MLLIELEVENFRSLEAVSLLGLQQLNVLIGPNNSGKSAVLGALDYLRRVTNGESMDTTSLVTGGDNRKQIRIRLRFRLGDQERQRMISNLAELTEMADSRRDRIINSSFLRMIQYRFESVQNAPQMAHVIETSMLSEDGKWAAIQRIVATDRSSSNPQTTVRPFPDLFRARERLDSSVLDVTTKGGQTTQFSYNFAASGDHVPFNPANPYWPYDFVREYLRSLFVFSTHRHSVPRLEVQQSQRLDPTGSNLAQVLNTILNNRPSRFREIEKLVKAALPSLNELQTPLIERQTEVGFHLPIGDHDVRLQDTGGGVEQILMIAVVLVTTGVESTMLLEEPENHMHPAAQRFLLERISSSGRQVLLTTHSPTFVNTPQARSLYRVTYKNERTGVSHVSNPDALSEVLNEIGARNSDVLMNDGVLFVEGPSDRETFMVWSDILGKDLAGSGVGIVSMGGAAQALKAAPIQADVMAGISQKAPVPHLFVLDRDERTPDETAKLTEKLGDGVRFLERREIENYLLSPRAILAVIREKSESASKTPPEDSSEVLVAIAKGIDEIADSLFGTVLLKRLRSSLPSLIGGPLPSERVEELLSHASAQELPLIVRREIEVHFADYLSKLDLDASVREGQSKLQEEWRDKSKRLAIAPGEEILDRLFDRYGLKYNKGSDGVRIARSMGPDEIPEEIKQIVSAAASLGRPA